MLQALAGVAAQTAADAERLTRLGASQVAVTGNVKFDVAVPDTTVERGRALRRLFGESRPVWVAGSTREGEETLLLAALARAPLPADALLVIVPRHPQRFDAVAELLGQRGLQFVRRSAGQPVPAGISIVLGDTMGEMLAYYAAADVAFIGGSLLPLGGQNLIEPLAVGTPVLIGPSTFNFAEAARDALARGAARQGADADAIVVEAAALLRDPEMRARMTAAGTRVAGCASRRDQANAGLDCGAARSHPRLAGYCNVRLTASRSASVRAPAAALSRSVLVITA